MKKPDRDFWLLVGTGVHFNVIMNSEGTLKWARFLLVLIKLRPSLKQITAELQLWLRKWCKKVGRGKRRNCSTLSTVLVLFRAAFVLEWFGTGCWHLFEIEMPYSITPTPPSITSQSGLSIWMWCWNLVLNYEICSITFSRSQYPFLIPRMKIVQACPHSWAFFGNKP